METARLWRAIRQRATTLVLASLAAGAAALAFTYLLTEKYEATAIVLIRPEEHISIAPPGSDSRELFSYPVAVGQAKPEAPRNSYLKILESRAIAEMVVEKLQLDVEESPTPGSWSAFLRPIRRGFRRLVLSSKEIALYGRTFPPQSDLEQAIEDFQEDASFDSVKDSYLFEISYLAKNPARAAEVANTTAELFLDYMAEMNTTEREGALRFIGEQLAESELQLAAAREALRAFKEAHDVADFDEQVTEAVKLVGHLTTNLETTRTTLSGLNQVYQPSNVKVTQVQAEGDYLRAALAERRQRLAELPGVEAKLERLDLEVTVNEKVYQLLKLEYEQARIRQAKRISEMRLVSRATPPQYPKKPLRVVYVGAAVLLVLQLGVGLIALQETLRTRIRSVEGVEQVRDARVLATLPLEPPAAPGA